MAVKSEAEWRPRFYSYIPLLCKTLRLTEPKRVLEWGTGESTSIMHQLCPDAEIFSIEESKEFFDEYSKMNKGKVHIYHVPIIDGYAAFPLTLGGQFDLIFVDGKDSERPDCLKVAFKLVTENGTVILHDSDREWYREAISLFKIVEELDGTVALKK